MDTTNISIMQMSASIVNSLVIQARTVVFASNAEAQSPAIVNKPGDFLRTSYSQPII